MWQEMKFHYLILLCCFIISCGQTDKIERYDVHGIDVSHHQGKINWKLVHAQGNSFAFIKATEGGDFRDSLFQANWEAARNEGILCGAYHFFRPETSPEAQAQNFIFNVNLAKGDLPPVLDFELMGQVPREDMINFLQTWLDLVEAHYGIKPILYTNLKLYYRVIAGRFDDYNIWIARYGEKAPTLPLKQDWAFWQYGNRGQLDGINTNVDFNVFNGSIDALKAMGLKTTSPPTILQ